MFNKLKKYRLIFIKDEGLYAKELKLKNLILPFSLLSILTRFTEKNSKNSYAGEPKNKCGIC